MVIQSTLTPILHATEALKLILNLSLWALIFRVFSVCLITGNKDDASINDNKDNSVCKCCKSVKAAPK